MAQSRNLASINDGPDDPSATRSSRTVMVTGGAGFLGSHLCERLVAESTNVICVDNFHTGRRENITSLMSSGKFRLIQHDVINPLNTVLEPISEIYNLACPASPPHYQTDPVKTALICALGTYNCLQLAEQNGARIFHASTSEIYGDPEIHPQTESYHGNVNTIGPRSCYDEGKRYAETLITDFGKKHSLITRIVRIFNTYGPRMQPDDGRVVSNFIVQSLLGKDITIYGNGQQTRSFCYVDDLIEGFARLMAADHGIDGPVNIGNPVENTVEELALLITEMVGSRSKLVRRPLPTDDPRRRRPDITQACEKLDWMPKVSLRDGLARTIDYFERELRHGVEPLRRFAGN